MTVEVRITVPPEVTDYYGRKVIRVPFGTQSVPFMIFELPGKLTIEMFNDAMSVMLNHA